MSKLKSYKIKDAKLLDTIFTHRSIAKQNNERLEFLGDAVLNLVIADLLVKQNPQDTEGDLTKKRSYLVSGLTLAKIAIDLNLPTQLKVREEAYKKNHRILAGLFEAYIGAIYLEAGFLDCKKMIQGFFKNLLTKDILDYDYKSILQEWCQKKYKEVPDYKIKKEEGQEHEKTFFIDVFIKNKICGSAFSRQKKQAERLAAKKAIQKLKIPIKK